MPRLSDEKIKELSARNAKKRALGKQGGRTGVLSAETTARSRRETDQLEEKTRRENRVKRYNVGGGGYSGKKRSFYTPL